eukprot:jgi/Hompol1/1443/HPOL_001139-RA
MIYTSATVVAVLASLASAQLPFIPADFDRGDCVTGRINFDQSRAFSLGGNDTARFGVDRSKYDFTIDYNPGNVAFTPNGVQLSLLPALPGA